MPSALQGLRLRLGVEGTRRAVESFALPSLRRALLVFAHMDDEINAVGLMRRLRAQGVELDLMVLTDGAANPWTDARVVGATLRAGETAEYPLGKDRKAYLVPAKGAVQIDDVRVNARDGAAISDIDVLRVTAIEDSEIVLVDAA